MGFSKVFTIISDDDGDWIDVDEFIAYLKNNCKYDKVTIKRANIVKELDGSSKASIKVVDGKKTAKIASILRYIFRHSDGELRLNGCVVLSSMIQHDLLKTKPSESGDSIFELYKCIAQTSLKSRTVENATLPLIEVQECATLLTDYKKSFTESEWKKICIFESSYSKRAISGAIYEDDISARWKWFKFYKATYACCTEWRESSKRTIALRSKRKIIAQEQAGPEILAHKKHIPGVVDSHLIAKIFEYFPDVVVEVAVVDHIDSRKSNSIDVYIELTSVNQDTSDLAQFTARLALKDHCVQCREIVFVSPMTFDGYKSKDGHMARFQNAGRHIYWIAI